jgi:hypothetical protein
MVWSRRLYSFFCEGMQINRKEEIVCFLVIGISGTVKYSFTILNFFRYCHQILLRKGRVFACQAGAENYNLDLNYKLAQTQIGACAVGACGLSYGLFHASGIRCRLLRFLTRSGAVVHRLHHNFLTKTLYYCACKLP